jgi:catechol 2,3-dioxygenase-like lactoylglutathione lyase family enzyme
MTRRVRISHRRRSRSGASSVLVLLVVDRDRENTVAVIRGGNATIYVSDMQRAVDFYHKTLELPLVFRAADHWAELDAGGGLHLGLHPASARGPAPGTPGGITVGLAVDEPIALVVETLRNRGVIVDGPIVDAGGLALAFFTDPDGNPLYLAETTKGAS